MKKDKKKYTFLHIIGPDTKNTYGIISQIYKHCDMSKHQVLVSAYEEARNRFPKMKEWDGLMFIPHKGGKLKRILFFYRTLRDAEHIIWHSLFFTTKKYLLFLYFFKSFLKKSTWIEWGADLYLWEHQNPSFKQKILNHIGRKIREGFPNVGLIFPTDEVVYREQFGGEHRFFYTPMCNPMKEANGLAEFIDANKPEIDPNEERTTLVQVAHNSFFFNHHVKLLNYLEHFKNENVKFILPLAYGVAGINGSFGGRSYLNAVKKYAVDMFGKKACIQTKGLPFEDYVKLLWKTDVAVFDFDRPCGLGNLRILLYMGKKVYLPAGNPFFDFFISHGVKVYDTNKIPEMTFEEFIAPPEDTDLTWIRDYSNNEHNIRKWLKMFDELEGITDTNYDIDPPEQNEAACEEMEEMT